MARFHRMNRMCWRSGVAVAIAVSLCVSDFAHSALIPPFFINSVVALGAMQRIPQAGQEPRVEWVTEGTGFFYGYLVGDDPDISKRQYEIYLVTAKHVVRDHPKELGDLKIRLNPKDSSSEVAQFAIPSEPKPGEATWFFHPDEKIDVAAVRVNFLTLREHGLSPDFFTNDEHSANRERLGKIEAAAGDGVFVLGFPMNLAGAQRNYVIVRQGVIARLSEMLDRASLTFMIDAFIFPGNSGGPVVLRPQVEAVGGTKSQPRAYLIGLVTSYRPYTDVALSMQSKRPRVTFEENSGLAEVLPSDFIDEAIAAWRSTQGVRGPER